MDIWGTYSYQWNIAQKLLLILTFSRFMMLRDKFSEGLYLNGACVKHIRGTGNKEEWLRKEPFKACKMPGLMLMYSLSIPPIIWRKIPQIYILSNVPRIFFCHIIYRFHKMRFQIPWWTAFYQTSRKSINTCIMVMCRETSIDEKLG